MDGASAAVGVAVADGELLVDGQGVAVLEGRYHRYGLHHRAGFVGQYGAVHGLDVSAGVQRVALEVGDGLDVAGGHFHYHGRAPVGVAVDEHLAEFALEDVLYGDVDGGCDGVAVARLLDGPFGHAVGEHHALGLAGGAVEQGVEGLFEAGDAALRVLAGEVAHAAYAEAGHVAVGVHASQHRLKLEARAVGVARAAEEGECLEALRHVEGHVAHQAVGAAALAARLGEGRREVFAPLFAVAAGEVHGQRVGEAVERLHVLAYVETLGAEVDAYVVVVEVGGQDGAVAGEDIAAQRRYGGDGVELALALAVPGLGVDDGGVEQHEHDGYGHAHHEHHDDTEVEHDARAALAVGALWRGGGCVSAAHCRRGV